MTALWSNGGRGWGLLSPAGFSDEATLHGLVADAPQLLPLSGAPKLIVVGREVPLGGGYADLVAIETTGRLVVIEVKLARNSEARRAVVAQVLTYAAFLHGSDPATVEREVLGNELRKRGQESLGALVAANDQEGTFDADKFADALNENLASGAFRLVLVLDEVPKDLVRLVGYLETVSESLVIDLITVTAYDINGTTIVVPQRIDPERAAAEPPRPAVDGRSTSAPVTAGAEEFLRSISAAPEDQQPELRRLCDWAIRLEREGLVRLGTGRGKGRWTLLPRLVADDAGLVTIWNENGAYLSLWRSVFERRAPDIIPIVEAAIGTRIGTGNTVRELSDEALAALTTAYRTAARSDDAIGLS